MSTLLNAALAAVLLALAGLQLNDPDPLFWVGLYAVAALPALLCLLRRSAEPWFWIASGYCLAGLAASLGGGLDYLRHWQEDSLLQSMSADKPYIEQAREAIGAVIALGLLWLQRRYGSPGTST